MPRGKGKQWAYGNSTAAQKVLITYNPDPFYNLDEQLCKTFAKTFAQESFYVIVTTISSAKDMQADTFDMYMFCANTYNWAPDWPTVNFIQDKIDLKNKPVLALTIGSGSTKKSQQKLNKNIKAAGARLIDSKTLWLLRPNDESRIKEKNTEVAKSLVKDWASEIAKKLNQSFK